MQTELTPAMQTNLDIVTDAFRAQFQQAQARMDRRAQGPAGLKLARTILGMSREQLHGADREALEESARRAGKPFDPQRISLSFRDLSKGVASAGGFLTQTTTQDSLDILRPFSVLKRMGVTTETGLVGDQAIPKVTANTTPAWLSTEVSQGTPSQPTLAQIALTPKTVGTVVQFSRQLSKQANADAFVAHELLRTIGTVIDQAILNGSGASGQPLGLLNTTGIQTQSGTTLNSGVNTMKRKSAEANVTDESIAFLSTPLVRETLEGREKATGGGKFVWDKDLVADRPAMVSTDMPTATMICGDFSLVYLGFWGAGLVLEINPYEQTNFRAGIIQARVLVSCDVAVLHPAAFVVASSIT